MVITSVVYPQEKKFVVDIPAGRHICTVDGRHTSRHKSIKNVTNVVPPPSSPNSQKQYKMTQHAIIECNCHINSTVVVQLL